MKTHPTRLALFFTMYKHLAFTKDQLYIIILSSLSDTLNLHSTFGKNYRFFTLDFLFFCNTEILIKPL